MRPAVLENLRPAWVRRARFALEMAAPRKYLFVVSHMRSYSSLLCHILNSNPAIDGYVEMHRPYNKELDLLELTFRVRSTTGSPLKGRYVVDKILFNYPLDDQILKRRDVHAIFSVRNPDQAVRSILAMGARRKKPDWKSDPEKAVAYYVRRMRRMSQQAKVMRSRSLYFEADELVDNPDRVLESLTGFLRLDRPLRPQYETSQLTGRGKWGDASKFIRSGEIVRERDDYSEIELPEPLLRKAQDAYDEARTKLAKFCEVAVSPAPPVHDRTPDAEHAS